MHNYTEADITEPSGVQLGGMPDGAGMSKTTCADRGLVIEFCGESYVVPPGVAFTVGRDADLILDDNPRLPRTLLHFSERRGVWFVHNAGPRLSVTVMEESGRLQSALPPEARLPLVFARSALVFRAGPTTYEFRVAVASPLYAEAVAGVSPHSPTRQDLALTSSQLLLILALAEPALQRVSGRITEVPPSAEVASRLGWAITRFNRKLDNVCDKLDRAGVPGLRGGVRSLATNRRVRLVEYAVATGIVSRADLPLLDQRRVSQDPDTQATTQFRMEPATSSRRPI